MCKLITALIVLSSCAATFAASSRGKVTSDAFVDRKIGEEKKTNPNGTKWDAMDVGPFFTSGFGGQHPACKSISIKLDGTNAVAAFDTELLRMTMAWSGGFLKLPSLRGGLEGFPEPIGTPIFTTPSLPGWGKKGDFADPRPVFHRFDYGMNSPQLVPFPMDVVYGHLPDDWGHWKGFYRHGEQVVLSYSIGKRDVLEMPGFTQVDNLPIITRSFQIEGPAEKMELLVCDASTLTKINLGKNYLIAIDETKSTYTAVGVVGLKNPDFDIKEGSVILKISGDAKTQLFKVLVSSGPHSEVEKCQQAFAGEFEILNLKDLCHGGPSLWGQPLVTIGKLGTGDEAYVADTITLPETNPWKSWIRASGFDFFSDGRAALCSVSGDVWIVSGIDDKLENITWKRFATGLFQPLGLKIIKDTVYVTCRDEIVRLHDLNGDGEADFYENFNNDVAITAHYHEFCLNLEADSKGNLYFCKGSNLREASTPFHGTLLRLSPDGKKLDIVCNGLRAPNGLGMGPHDEITVADNEGKWTPASRVNLIKPGGFYGNVFTAYTAKPHTNGYDLPLFWIPHNNNIDNSSGGQVWVTSDKWGPLKGHMLHTSYGTSSLFEVMQEEVDGTQQAGVVKFPLKFESGIMRGRFSPFDGQLYLCGLVVWQSNGGKEGAFHRVRYTGKTVHMPTEFHLRPQGVEITFACPLDAATASDPQNYGVEVWNYRWTSDYGSKEYSVKNPDEDKHDEVEIKSVKLSSDRKTVTLELAELKPVMQMKIQYNIDAEDGSTMKQEIFNSVFQVPTPALSQVGR